jgi:hypothetical protein
MRIKLFHIILSIASTIVTVAIISSCHSNSDKEKRAAEFEIKNFCATVNYLPEIKNSVKEIFIDYKDALEGFVIPSINQCKGGYFRINFEIKNLSTNNQAFYYKLYYQNLSYKFNEKDTGTLRANPLAEENFYGSWEDTNIEFKQTPIISKLSGKALITDSFRIVGNPRNEKIYFDGEKNNRWKRNPRVGTYKFTLVVCTQNDLNIIPKTIKNIALKNESKFDNPFYFFNEAENNTLNQTIFIDDSVALKVSAKPKIKSGIYVNDFFMGDKERDRSYFCSSCGQSPDLFCNAPFQQFINYVDASTKFNNIPVVADVLKGNYSSIEYNWNKQFTSMQEFIPTTINTTKSPCKNIFVDTLANKIVIKNPKTRVGEWNKESVGVITRHGFTYGKYRVKLKLTELLNKYGVWNGITNAVWLITQGGGEWNFRNKCTKSGYMQTYWGGPNDKRVEQTDYSEIDFEINNSPLYCPENNFPPVYKNSKSNQRNLNDWNVKLPEDMLARKNKVTVSCTNWDMACSEPPKFSVNCNTIDYQGATYHTFRWDSAYRALTERSEALDDELFAGEFYYFEIDWRPTEIIWRIGASPDKMRIVGYMNDQVTSIPNNQMLLIISQEFHNTVWWPGVPYKQEYIPFPLKDIPGEIYELVIE